MEFERIDKKPLKIYQNILLGTLISVLIVGVGLLAYSIVFPFLGTEFEVDDLIICYVCLVLALGFISLEIFNTINSKKKGSIFIISLLFNDENELNEKFYISMIVVSVIFGILFLYSFLTVCQVPLPYFGFIDPMISVIAIFSLVVTHNALAIIFFKKVAHLDKAYKENKNNKNKEFY